MKPDMCVLRILTLFCSLRIFAALEKVAPHLLSSTNATPVLTCRSQVPLRRAEQASPMDCIRIPKCRSVQRCSATLPMCHGEEVFYGCWREKKAIPPAVLKEFVAGDLSFYSIPSVKQIWLPLGCKYVRFNSSIVQSCATETRDREFKLSLIGDSVMRGTFLGLYRLLHDGGDTAKAEDSTAWTIYPTALSLKEKETVYFHVQNMNVSFHKTPNFIELPGNLKLAKEHTKTGKVLLEEAGRHPHAIHLDANGWDHQEFNKYSKKCTRFPRQGPPAVVLDKKCYGRALPEKRERILHQVLNNRYRSSLKSLQKALESLGYSGDFVWRNGACNMRWRASPMLELHSLVRDLGFQVFDLYSLSRGRQETFSDGYHFDGYPNDRLPHLGEMNMQSVHLLLNILFRNYHCLAHFR